jgi:hypothetical protein
MLATSPPDKVEVRAVAEAPAVVFQVRQRRHTVLIGSCNKIETRTQHEGCKALKLQNVCQMFYFKCCRAGVQSWCKLLYILKRDL